MRPSRPTHRLRKKEALPSYPRLSLSPCSASYMAPLAPREAHARSSTAYAAGVIVERAKIRSAGTRRARDRGEAMLFLRKPTGWGESPRILAVLRPYVNVLLYF